MYEQQRDQILGTQFNVDSLAGAQEQAHLPEQFYFKVCRRNFKSALDLLSLLGSWMNHDESTESQLAGGPKWPDITHRNGVIRQRSTWWPLRRWKVDIKSCLPAMFKYACLQLFALVWKGVQSRRCKQRSGGDMAAWSMWDFTVHTTCQEGKIYTNWRRDGHCLVLTSWAKQNVGSCLPALPRSCHVRLCRTTTAVIWSRALQYV